MANEDNRNDAAAFQRGVRQLLSGFQMAGAQSIPRPRTPLTSPATEANPGQAAAKVDTSAAVASTTAVASAKGVAATSVSTGLPVAGRTEAMQVLASEVASCTTCTALAETRNKTVFGVGNPAARLCLLGEAPGANEDRQGEPFVGQAGQLLDKILAACTLSRQDVYILNVIKCRPPGNRNPAAEEVANCRSFFERQLEIIQPEFICCLGSVAAQNLLDTSESVGRLRGRFHDWHGIQVMVTYHPAYLLRNPSAKGEVWKDMKFLMAEMGIALPKR